MKMWGIFFEEHDTFICEKIANWKLCYSRLITETSNNDSKNFTVYSMAYMQSEHNVHVHVVGL